MQCAETLRRTWTTYIGLRARTCGPEEPSIPEGEAVRDCDNELCETTGSRLAVRPIVQQKGLLYSMRSLWPGEGRVASSKVLQCDWAHDISTIYSGRVGWLGHEISAKARGTLGSMALATLGHRGAQDYMCWGWGRTGIYSHSPLTETKVAESWRLMQGAPNQTHALMEMD